MKNCMLVGNSHLAPFASDKHKYIFDIGLKFQQIVIFNCFVPTEPICICNVHQKLSRNWIFWNYFKKEQIYICIKGWEHQKETVSPLEIESINERFTCHTGP